MDLNKDIFNDYVYSAKRTLTEVGIPLDQEPEEFLLAVNKARRIMGRSRRKSSRISTTSTEEQQGRESMEREVLDFRVGCKCSNRFSE